jgi:prepilin-type N-terminal cleavage/methylation domain-containing protein
VHTRRIYSAFSLLEVLIVIAIIGVASAFVAPDISDWNCKQETQNDFEGITGFLNTLRVEATGRNRTMQVRVVNNGRVSIFKAYQGNSKYKQACNSGSWTYLGGSSAQGGSISDYQVKAILTVPSSKVCFNADSTATALSSGGGYDMARSCGGTKIAYRANIFGATGFIERLKWNSKASQWDEQ